MSEESAGRWVTGTSLGEGIAVVILLGMLAALAVSGTRGVQSRIRVLEAIGAASADKVQWMEHWAVTGLWPTPAPGRAFPVSVLAPPASAPYTEFTNVQTRHEDVEDGSLSFRFAEPRSIGIAGVPFRVGDAALQGYSVGIRPAFASADAPTSVVWLCGYAEPPPGFVAPTKNLTNVPPALLPSPCRAPFPAER